MTRHRRSFTFSHQQYFGLFILPKLASSWNIKRTILYFLWFKLRCFWYFNSHACDFCKHKQANFNSHASCEVRQSIYRRQKTFLNFNSHASCEARLYAAQNAKNIIAFQLTRLLRGATNTGNGFADTLLISTHTPLARRDDITFLLTFGMLDFNSHASCEARRASWLNSQITK